MDSRTDAPDSSGGMYGRVLSGGPKLEGPLGGRGNLGPPALWWQPELGDASIQGGVTFDGTHYSDRMAVGDVQPFRCTPILVAYPRDGQPPNVWYQVLGGRVHLAPDNSVAPGGPGGAGGGAGTFAPAPDLAFALGVELPGDVARRLGHSAAATSVYPGSPGNCRRPRLLSLVGSRPRLALSQLGQLLLEQKGFPPCAPSAEH